MKPQETIDYFKRMLACASSEFSEECINKPCEECPHDFDSKKEGEAYKAALAALEKQVPKKPVPVTIGEALKFYSCPNCVAVEKPMAIYPSMKCCVQCGQRIDWDGVKDESDTRAN